jgi:Xaa-Pro aminopeptidase
VDYFASRREKLRRCLHDEEIDVLLISHPINVTYLTGFTGESSYLALGRERVLLVSDGRFTTQIAEECPGLETHIRPTAQNLYQATAEALAKLGFHSVGFESCHLTVAEFETLRGLAPALTWKAGSDRIEKLRVLKDPTEVAQIRTAIAIAERAFVALKAMLERQQSEKELCDALEQYVRRFGGRWSSFPSIVAVDERSALPHAPPTERTLAESYLLLVDWGADGGCYKSDLTRVLVPRHTSAVSRPSPPKGQETKLEEVYAVVLRAQERALRTIRPGVKANEVDAAARAVIAEAGYGDFFNHGLGHGLGLQVHEAPAVRPNSDVPLLPGMVVTVEPGIYIPKWGGIRIEDDVLVTSEGYEVLTTLPKDLQSSLCEI